MSANSDEPGRSKLASAVAPLVIGLTIVVTIASILLFPSAPVFIPTQPTDTPITPGNVAFEAIMVRVTDLPPGWGTREVKSSLIEGEAQFTTYFAPYRRDPWFNISEKFFLFPEEASARKAFLVHQDKLFPPGSLDSWLAQPDLEFPHHADEWKVACLKSGINNLKMDSCHAIGRYHNMLMQISAPTYEWDSLTKAEYKVVLIAVDHRFALWLDKLKAP